MGYVFLYLGQFISRFMNMSSWVDWGIKMLRCYTNFPNDTESIRGAMKSFLNVISDMLIANQRNGSDLEMLCENVSKSIYYDDLLKMIKSYPNESVLISDFVASPLSLNKRLHMSLFRRLVKLRWKLYAKLNPQKSFDLRGNILKISN